MNPNKQIDDQIDQEIQDLLNAIQVGYGYDFNDYAQASLKRRLTLYRKKHSAHEFGYVVSQLVSKKKVFVEFLNDIMISTTELFRDPEFFLTFRKLVVPYLQTLPSFKMWHAGCSTGEEVYSMGILLSEYGLLSRALIYGTDINSLALEKAKTGQVSKHIIDRDSKKYIESGGGSDFSKYWVENGAYSILDPAILKKIVFGEHNLVTDSSFGEMQVVCCRNVMIYFNTNLQNKVMSLFQSCLSDGGYLCLGSKESILGSTVQSEFITIGQKARIYRKL